MANHVNLTFHGAAKTVTGSCMEIESEGARTLVDCGLFQGSRTLETLNYGAFTFAPETIDAVVLTHAHIDHCGLLPKLVAQGFEEPIFCTAQTSDLLQYMLADAGRIQEFEAQHRNRRRDRAGEATIAPLYTEHDGLTAWRQTRPVPLEEWFEPAAGFRARLWNAGHILGATSAEVDAGGVRLLCSGDLGPQNKAFHADPEGPSTLDYVICESTYGSRTRVRLSIDQRRDLLEEEVNKAISRGGNLVIPAFALERTQELLLDIAYLADANRIPDVPVFVDSPLANRATSVFARHAGELEDLGGKDIFHHPAIHYVDDASASMRINSMSGVIIIAASGMCEAGRIRHHLAHNLHRRDSTILFVGFQAQGSLGRVILEGARHVKISGTDVDVRAHIRRIDSYSAHADQAELLDWIKGRKPISGSLFLTHGEPGAISALTELASEDDPSLSIITPDIGESYQLQSGTPAKLIGTARTDAAQLIGRDWQNDYADFAVSLKRRLAQIPDAMNRRKAVAEMRKVLERYGI
ncbi:MBL fold metallo-hydrolase [Rhodococcus opacus]|uniref:MBL fold metallo-hydrolase n=1 Tax=Rhodococcus opacus TaxID=37919 RepID=UPI00295398C2|nr:MBL fold metallo-hydrolase [Rhodococcus opacus]MDV7084320.1 MBL fold metallo-hydrolase [Rhodococcus opacus]